MKHITSKTLLLAAALTAGFYFSSCKSKAKDPDTTTVAPASTDNNTMQAPPPPPVTVAPYDTLSAGARDATRDFPGVTASVENGEITLTGNITRDKLPGLMRSLSSLHAKKINNNLKVGK